MKFVDKHIEIDKLPKKIQENDCDTFRCSAGAKCLENSFRGVVRNDENI